MTRRRWTVGLLSVLVLAAGLGAAAWLMLSETPPQRGAEGPRGALVRTVTVEPASYHLDTEAQGAVVPARRVQVQPQVSGRIVDIHPHLIPGGVVRQDEVLFRVDPQDYRLAVEELEGQIAQTEAELALERGRQEVAEEEWQMFAGELEEGQGDRALATRQPQLQAAQAQLQAARNRLDRAQLDLARTTVEVPFDAFIEEESAALGSLVGPQAPVVTLVGTDRFWLRLAVPADRIPYIAIPGVNAEQGALVKILQDVGGRTIEREGRVLRLEGRLNPQGRMAQVLVEIPDPLNLAELEPEDALRGIPLLIDAFVTAVIRGPEVDGLIELPRAALREGDQAYVYADGRLEVRKLNVVWRRPDTVLVSEGLGAGDRVIVSPLSQPYDGMRLRVEREENGGG